MTQKVKITTYNNERINMYTLKIEKGNETEIEGFENYGDMHMALLKCVVEALENKCEYTVEHINL